MQRLHLFEWEDFPWCPASIRDGCTDYLRFMLNLGDSYAPVVPKLTEALKQSNATAIVDLCAGGGGPWPRLLPALRTAGMESSVTLTDRYPNPASAAALPDVTYYPESVDALAVPATLPGFRTLFSSFHHFTPAAGKALIQSAVEAGQPIGIFEATQRSPLCLLMMLPTPIVAILATPFIRPFRLSRLLLTYVLPLIPLMILWDGVVSCFRTYTPEELKGLAESIPGSDHYTWESGLAKGASPLPVTYLIGLPKGIS
ncbi:MAG: hypothetical protein QM758_14170 [Armatimonas sp.]